MGLCSIQEAWLFADTGPGRWIDHFAGRLRVNLRADGSGGLPAADQLRQQSLELMQRIAQGSQQPWVDQRFSPALDVDPVRAQGGRRFQPGEKEFDQAIERSGRVRFRDRVLKDRQAALVIKNEACFDDLFFAFKVR